MTKKTQPEAAPVVVELTPEQREEKKRRVHEANRRARVAGDPLNITGHTPKKIETRDQMLERQKARGKRWVKFWAPDGTQVEVDLRKNPLLGVYRKGDLSAPQFAAANSCVLDWEKANYAGLKCRGFEPGVDTSTLPSVNIQAIDAQKRLLRVKALVGPEVYMILEAVLVERMSFSEINGEGGDHKRVLGGKLRNALDRIATHIYGYQDGDGEGATIGAIKRVRAKREARRDHPFR